MQDMIDALKRDVHKAEEAQLHSHRQGSEWQSQVSRAERRAPT